MVSAVSSEKLPARRGSSAIAALKSREYTLAKAQFLASRASELKSTNELYHLSAELLGLTHSQSEMPRIVLLGQQSMGKTTLLDSLLGAPVGFVSGDLGTRQPTVYSLSPSVDGKLSVKFQDRELASMEELADNLHSHMQSRHSITGEELHIDLKIDNSPHMVLVDLPGIRVDNRQNAEITKSVVKTYVENNPNDIYVLVKSACEDPANWHHEIRHFFTAPVDKGGLALPFEQTIVVNTRSKQFLDECYKENPTAASLLERLEKKELKTGGGGRPYRSYMLELYQLSQDDRSQCSFEIRTEMVRNALKTATEYSQTALHLFRGNDNALARIAGQFQFNCFKKDLEDALNHQVSARIGAVCRGLGAKFSRLREEHERLIKLQKEAETTAPMDELKKVIKTFATLAQRIKNGHYDPVVPVEEFCERFTATLYDDLLAGQSVLQECEKNKSGADTFNDTLSRALSSTRDMTTCSSVEESNEWTKVQMKMNEAAAKLWYVSRQQLKFIEQASSAADYRHLENENYGPVGRFKPQLSCEAVPGQLVRRVCYSKDGIASSMLVGMLISDQYMMEAEGTKEWQVKIAHFSRDEECKSWWERARVKSKPVVNTHVLLPLDYLVKCSNLAFKNLVGWRLHPKQSEANQLVNITPCLIERELSKAEAKEHVGPDLTRFFVVRDLGLEKFVSAKYVNPLMAQDDLTEQLGERAYRKLVGSTGAGGPPYVSDSLLKELGPSDDPTFVAMDWLFVDARAPDIERLIRPSNMVLTGGSDAPLKVCNHLSVRNIHIWLKNVVSSVGFDHIVSDDWVAQNTAKIEGMAERGNSEHSLVYSVKAYCDEDIQPIMRVAAGAATHTLQRMLDAAFAEMTYMQLKGTGDQLGLALLGNNQIKEQLRVTAHDYCQSLCETAIARMKQVMDAATRQINRVNVFQTMNHLTQFALSLDSSNEACLEAVATYQRAIAEREKQVRQTGVFDSKTLNDLAAIYFLSVVESLSIAWPLTLLNVFDVEFVDARGPFSSKPEGLSFESVLMKRIVEGQTDESLIQKFGIEVRDYKQAIAETQHEARIVELNATVLTQLQKKLMEEPLSFADI